MLRAPLGPASIEPVAGPDPVSVTASPVAPPRDPLPAAAPSAPHDDDTPARIDAIDDDMIDDDMIDDDMIDDDACCKVCHKGKACGDTCMARERSCTVPAGCACDG